LQETDFFLNPYLEFGSNLCEKFITFINQIRSFCNIIIIYSKSISPMQVCAFTCTSREWVESIEIFLCHFHLWLVHWGHWDSVRLLWKKMYCENYYIDKTECQIMLKKIKTIN